MFLSFYFNSLPNFFDIGTKFSRKLQYVSVVWPKFHRWQQPSKNSNHVVKIAVIRNGFLQANEWPERLHTMQCIASNLSLFLVFTLYFVSLVKKVRVGYSLIAESCKIFSIDV